MAFEKELQVYQDSLSKPVCQTQDREVNPFRGLEFFDSEHAPFFCGRTKTVGQLLSVLQQQVAAKRPFVLVLGPEGCGKTSLVRAGILPVLTQIRITEGDRFWRVAFTRPGNVGAGDPFDALAAALLDESAVPEFPDAATHDGWQKLAAELREAPENAALRLLDTLQYLSVQALDHFLDAHEVSPANPEQSAELPGQDELGQVVPKVQLALVVDQLEELFVRGFSPELQLRYIAALSALVKWRAAFVVAMLRSDFYTSFKKLCIREEALKGRFHLHPPSPQELRDMIHLPAEATGLRFELDPETGRSLDTALLEAMEVDAKPLPLLEHLLWQLCRNQLSRKDGVLRWSDYHELGKLDGALAKHAESVFSALDENAQAAFKSIIRQLVSTRPGDVGALISRTVPYHDLVSAPELSERQKTVAEGVIDQFIKEGLFHAEKTGPNAEVQVGVTQECLLRNWPRVRQLLTGDLGLLRVRDRLEANFKLWLSRGRRRRDLLHSGPSISEAETLLRSFQASLGDAQVDYLQKSLKAQRARRWLQNGALLALGAGLVIFLTIPAAKWWNADIRRQKAEKSAGLQGQAANSAEPREGKVEAAQNKVELTAGQRDALQAWLKDTETKAQQVQRDAALAANQREAPRIQVKETEAKAQQPQKNAEVGIDQLGPLQAELKKVEEKVQKIAGLVAARPPAEEDGPSDGEPRQKNMAFNANQTESEQTQPPNAGLEVAPVASTEPLSSSIQPAQPPAMSGPAAAAGARNLQNRDAEAAAPIAVKSELVPKNEPLMGVEQRNR